MDLGVAQKNMEPYPFFCVACPPWTGLFPKEWLWRAIRQSRIRH